MNPRVRNSSSDQWCDACGNTGWVTLRGTVQEFGHTYSRGTTPCKWCELGTKRYAWATSDRAKESAAVPYEPISQFGWDDIEPVGPKYRPAPRRDLAALLYGFADEMRKTQKQLREAGPPLRYADPPWIAARRRRNERLVASLEGYAMSPVRDDGVIDISEAEKKLINERIVKAGMELHKLARPVAVESKESR